MPMLEILAGEDRCRAPLFTERDWQKPFKAMDSSSLAAFSLVFGGLVKLRQTCLRWAVESKHGHG